MSVLVNRVCTECGEELEIEVSTEEFDHLLRTGQNLEAGRDTRSILLRSVCSDCLDGEDEILVSKGCIPDPDDDDVPASAVTLDAIFDAVHELPQEEKDKILAQLQKLGNPKK